MSGSRAGNFLPADIATFPFLPAVGLVFVATHYVLRSRIQQQNGRRRLLQEYNLFHPKQT